MEIVATAAFGSALSPAPCYLMLCAIGLIRITDLEANSVLLGRAQGAWWRAILLEAL